MIFAIKHPCSTITFFIKFDSFIFVAHDRGALQFSSGNSIYVKLISDTKRDYDAFVQMCKG